MRLHTKRENRIEPASERSETRHDSSRSKTKQKEGKLRFTFFHKCYIFFPRAPAVSVEGEKGGRDAREGIIQQNTQGARSGGRGSTRPCTRRLLQPGLPSPVSFLPVLSLPPPSPLFSVSPSPSQRGGHALFSNERERGRQPTSSLHTMHTRTRQDLLRLLPSPSCPPSLFCLLPLFATQTISTHLAPIGCRPRVCLSSLPAPCPRKGALSEPCTQQTQLGYHISKNIFD